MKHPLRSMHTNLWKGGSDADELFYLRPNRLSHVIAAITVMGLHQEYKQSVSEWVYRLTGIDEDQQPVELKTHWRNIFKQHPEFFRESTSGDDKFSLILRRALDKRDGVRGALTDIQAKLLIDASITLHGKQVDQYRDRRWLINLLVPFFGGMLGATIGGLIALMK